MQEEIHNSNSVNELLNDEENKEIRNLVTPNNEKFFSKLISDKKAKKIFDERRALLIKHNIDLEDEQAIDEFEKTNRVAKKLLKQYKSRLKVLQKRHSR